jgi:voltage-gated potassium channel Kch
MVTRNSLEQWERRAEWPLAALALVFLAAYSLGATINSFGKAVWWSITTVTTVGYGDC